MKKFLKRSTICVLMALSTFGSFGFSGGSRAEAGPVSRPSAAYARFYHLYYRACPHYSWTLYYSFTDYATAASYQRWIGSYGYETFLR